jgi:hypothetical protein
LDKIASGEVIKVDGVDEALGLVFGWAIICKLNGEDYYDVQGDHIPEDAMMSAALDFMTHSRVNKEMHAGDETGFFPFAFPYTTEMAKAFGNPNPERTGLMVGVKPEPAVLAKFLDGTYTGFSIGGSRITDEPVEEAA